MERYGWIVTDVEQNDSTLSKKIIIRDIHPNFFKNIDDCIRSALSHDSSSAKRRYLKILKTSDVIHRIHEIKKNDVYGYLYLRSKKETQSEKISLFSHCSSLYQNMIDCVTARKCFENLNVNDEEGIECDEIKIAYFILLKDDDLLHELQKTF